MNKEYLKVLSIVKNTLQDITGIYESVNDNCFEDIKISQAIEKLQSDLTDFISEAKYYSKDATEGHLILMQNKRYSICGVELSCGSKLEVYNPQFDIWETGTIEHSSKYNGYYFLNKSGSNNIQLYDGMFCRIRK